MIDVVSSIKDKLQQIQYLISQAKYVEATSELQRVLLDVSLVVQESNSRVKNIDAHKQLIVEAWKRRVLELSKKVQELSEVDKNATNARKQLNNVKVQYESLKKEKDHYIQNEANLNREIARLTMLDQKRRDEYNKDLEQSIKVYEENYARELGNDGADDKLLTQKLKDAGSFTTEVHKLATEIEDRKNEIARLKQKIDDLERQLDNKNSLVGGGSKKHNWSIVESLRLSYERLQGLRKQTMVLQQRLKRKKTLPRTIR
jgi:chromosome segregation ATPase